MKSRKSGISAQGMVKEKQAHDLNWLSNILDNILNTNTESNLLLLCNKGFPTRGFENVTNKISNSKLIT